MEEKVLQQFPCSISHDYVTVTYQLVDKISNILSAYKQQKRILLNSQKNEMRKWFQLLISVVGDWVISLLKSINLPACSEPTCCDFRRMYFGVFSCISRDSRSLSPDPIRFLSRSRLPTFGSAWMPPFIDVVGIWSRTQFCRQNIWY